MGALSLKVRENAAVSELGRFRATLYQEQWLKLLGMADKIEQFIAIMSPLGLQEVCRTGIAALSRGPAVG